MGNDIKQGFFIITRLWKRVVEPRGDSANSQSDKRATASSVEVSSRLLYLDIRYMAGVGTRQGQVQDRSSEQNGTTSTMESNSRLSYFV